MRRRDFLTLLGAAVAWPSPVIGQSRSKVYRVGLLSAGAPIADNSSQGAALIRGFTQRGYNLGRNLAFERRGAEGHIDRLLRSVWGKAINENHPEQMTAVSRARDIVADMS